MNQRALTSSIGGRLLHQQKCIVSKGAQPRVNEAQFVRGNAGTGLTGQSRCRIYWGNIAQKVVVLSSNLRGSWFDPQLSKCP